MRSERQCKPASLSIVNEEAASQDVSSDQRVNTVAGKLRFHHRNGVEANVEARVQ